jgi:hypothetical protein
MNRRARNEVVFVSIIYADLLLRVELPGCCSEVLVTCDTNRPYDHINNIPPKLPLVLRYLVHDMA